MPESAFNNLSVDITSTPSEVQQLVAQASQDDPLAQLELGWCHYIGNGVSRDRDKAILWYQKAAEQGVKEAQDLLAHIRQEEGLLSDSCDTEDKNGPWTNTPSRIHLGRLVVALVLFTLVASLGTWSYFAARQWLHGRTVEKANIASKEAGFDASSGNSASISSTAMTQSSPKADLDGDGDVDFVDLSLFLDSWLEYTSPQQ